MMKRKRKRSVKRSMMTIMNVLPAAICGFIRAALPISSLSGSAAMQAALDLLAAETVRAIGVPTIVRASAEPCPGCV